MKLWMSVAVVGLMWVHGAQGQLERVTPRKPEKKATTTKKKEKPAVVKAAQQAGGGSGPALVGLKVVRSRAEIQAGDVKVSGVSVGVGQELDLLRGSEFAGVVGPYLGRPLTEGTINGLQKDIVRFYRDHGRPLVDVVFPEQTSVGAGVLQVFVLEAVLGKVEVEGNKWGKRSLYKGTVRLEENQAIDTETLLEDVDWLNQNPGRQVEVAFRPGEKAGTSDVVLRANEWDRPVRVFTGYENSGPYFNGEDRIFAGLNWFNALGTDQRFSYQYTTDTDLSYIHAHSASYEIPLPWRHTLTFYGGYIESKAKFATALFNQKGTSYQTSMRYEIPLPKLGQYSQSFSAGFDFKNFDNNLEFGGITLFGTAVDVGQFALAYKGRLDDKLGATAFRVETYLSPGGIGDKNKDTSFASQRAGSTADYAYARFNVQRDTKLGGGWLWTLKGLAQVSDGPLQGSEQFGIGGFGTVRGYDDREANGDNGWLFSTELVTPALPVMNLINRKIPDGVNFLAFYDMGEANVKNAFAGQDPNLTLNSAGLGLRYNYRRNMSVRFDYGWQLRDSGPLNPHSRNSSRGHIAVQISY